MAASHLVGKADFTYTASGSTSGTTHTLAAPLLVSPAESFVSRRRARTYIAENAVGNVLERFTIGSTSAPDEIEGTIRFEDDPAGLRAMLKEGMENDVTLTYRPDGSTGTTYPAKLLRAGGGPGDVVLNPDSGRFVLGEYQTKVVLRRVDGGDFEGLL